ncbi:heparinase II/III family protein [Tabrizicola sp.]|uniref:heparinase II/III family protein n=1 Tax=Tabrizicola sp. TaxID=2005166 RepID=UPI002735BA7A|nr:heparinase II/III family protein [Tabrizicola sp.]MDP3194125.1 heparinase II/III family protein [Tabrizicola sp.]
MGSTGSTSKRLDRLADRLAVMAARRARPAGGFVSQPEPRSIGLYTRGKQLVAGNILLAGHLAEAPGVSLWDLEAPQAFATEAQGFAWLDDLAALGTKEALARAQDWTWGWIDRYGRGKGPGWTPDLTGRRIIRWVHHATILLQARDKAQSASFYAALSRQATYLARRWRSAAEGLPRFEALTGLVYAGISLIGMEALISPAVQALAAACDADIDAEGGIPTRNPEELLEVLTLLTWSASAMTEANLAVPPSLSHAITRIAPALRALRHADGELARFHGGGRAAEGRLDQALASAAVRAGATPAISMGYARLHGGRTSVIVDAAAPPGGRAARTAHASTSAFELTSGRRPLVVNCGSGVAFGQAWHQAARATPSHSVLGMEGMSSSRTGRSGEVLEQRAQVTASRLTVGTEGTDLYLAHDGWLASHGLTASRSLTLAHDGRRLSGVDALTAMTAEARRRFEDAMTQTAMAGARFAIRFHLHPEVDATLDMGGAAVSMVLKSGEIWIFRFTGPLELTLEPSAYLENGRLNPRPCLQIVLRGEARGFETRIGWTLAKAKDTPLAIRDLEGVDPDVPPQK